MLMYNVKAVNLIFYKHRIFLHLLRYYLCSVNFYSFTHKGFANFLLSLFLLILSSLLL